MKIEKKNQLFNLGKERGNGKAIDGVHTRRDARRTDFGTIADQRHAPEHHLLLQSARDS